MDIAKHAARLEAESGRRLDEFPYSDEDYRRVAELRGLDRLRALKDYAYRRTLWALYWVCAAIHGVHPEAIPEPAVDEWDGYWSPADATAEEDTRARSLGYERAGIDGLLVSEWNGFERRLGEWGAKIFAQSGVLVSDSQKAQHRRHFHAMLRKRYGRSEAPARSPA